MKCLRTRGMGTHALPATLEEAQSELMDYGPLFGTHSTNCPKKSASKRVKRITNLPAIPLRLA